MTNITTITAWPRDKAHQLVQWAVWSRRRFVAVVAATVALLGVAATVTLTGIAMQVQDTVENAPPAPPTYDPGTLATGDPYAPSRATPTMASTPVVPVGATPDVPARGLITAWLAGAGKTDKDRAEWVASMAAYGGPALRAQLESARIDAVPHATVTQVQPAVMLNSATATVTLSTGQIVLVQLIRGDGAWVVQGFHAA